MRLCCQGNEKLATARSVKSALERQRQLEEALTLYKQITAQLDLPVVCNQFAQARFFKGTLVLVRLPHDAICTYVYMYM